MKYSDVIDQVSKKLNIPVEVVDEAYKSYWKFIRQTIQSLPLMDHLDEEEFNKLRTNFNIPSLGKLYITWDRLIGCKKRFNYLKNLKEDA